MLFKCFVVAVMFVGATWAQTTDLPNLLESVTIPDEFKDKLDPKAVEGIQNKSISEFKRRCEKNGGPDAFEKAEHASKDFYKCVTDLVNTTALQEEVEQAKPNGNVDEVFKKYCDKKPLIESCAYNLTEATKDCFSADEQKHLKTVYNVTEKLVEFICFKEGDRIALFIAEGGQECFQDRQDALRECFNKTFGDSMGPELEIESLSNVTLSFDEKQCGQMTELQYCVVAELEKCEKPTSSNIVESLFNFIRKATPCKKYADKEEKTSKKNAEAAKKQNSASSIYITSTTVLMTVTAALLAN